MLQGGAVKRVWTDAEILPCVKFKTCIEILASYRRMKAHQINLTNIRQAIRDSWRNGSRRPVANTQNQKIKDRTLYRILKS